MAGSHGRHRTASGHGPRATGPAHARMLAVLGPIVALAVAGVVWTVLDLGPGTTATSGLVPGAGAQVTESSTVRSVTAGVCEGAPEDRLPDGTIPDTALCATATVEIRSGPDSGSLVEVPVPPQVYRAGLAEGTRLTVERFTAGEPVAEVPSGQVYAWVDFDRNIPLVAVAIAFVLLVGLVGRLRGLGGLLGLAISYAMIVGVLVPALRRGEDPVVVALSCSIVIMTILLYLAHGFSARTTAALLGTIAGLVVSTAIAVWVAGAAHLNGLNDEESYVLTGLTGSADLSAIVLCGIIIAGLGVLNDVTITQVSAVWEVHEHAPDLGFTDLFRSGMRVGRDHLASTVYTIAFAYAGAALPTLLLIDLYDRTLIQVLTSGAIAEEIVRTAVGSIGLVLAIPITTAIAASAVAPRARRAQGAVPVAAPFA